MEIIKAIKAEVPNDLQAAQYSTAKYIGVNATPLGVLSYKFTSDKKDEVVFSVHNPL